MALNNPGLGLKLRLDVQDKLESLCCLRKTFTCGCHATETGLDEILKFTVTALTNNTVQREKIKRDK